MIEFKAIREKAREKRDAAIADAQATYRATMAQIDDLEQSLASGLTVKRLKISASVSSLIPSEGEFTMPQIMAGLVELDPERVWSKRVVTRQVTALRKRGLVRRIKRASRTNAAVYTRVAGPAKGIPLGPRQLIDVLRSVVVRPMTAMEAAVAAVEAGYRSSMKPERLKNRVWQLLNQGGFVRDGDKWLPQ